MNESLDPGSFQDSPRLQVGGETAQREGGPERGRSETERHSDKQKTDKQRACKRTNTGFRLFYTGFCQTVP